LPNAPPIAAESQRGEFISGINKMSPAEIHLTALIVRALQRDRPTEFPDSPDADLIRQCDRMIAINKATDMTHEVIRDDRARAIVSEPVDAEWFDVRRTMLNLPPPRSREGVRAAAKMMLSYTGGLDTYAEAIDGADLLMWFSRACAEYLAASSGEDGAPLDAMDLLNGIAARAMEDGADPSATVSPDHELLMLCDAVTMLRSQGARIREEWRAAGPAGDPGRHEILKEIKRRVHEAAPSLRKLAKMRAVTPAGIFAKAIVVRYVATSTATLADSLADDIVNSVELRQAIWPATKEGPV
jgi:hypothetical protein